MAEIEIETRMPAYTITFAWLRRYYPRDIVLGEAVLWRGDRYLVLAVRHDPLKTETVFVDVRAL